MVKKRIALVIGFVGFLVVSGWAQPLSRYDFRIKNFPKVWFATVNAGTNVYYGDHDTHNFAGDRMAPAIEIAVGKWLNPIWAIRGQYSGIAMEGLNFEQTDYTGETPGYGSMYIENFSYMNVHVDAMFNIWTQMNGYSENRNFDLLPFAGLGYARSWNGAANEAGMAFTMGLITKFTLVKSLDFNVEMKGTLLGDQIDGVTGREPLEGALTASFGFTYKFIGGGWSRPRYSPKVRRR